MKSLAKIAMLNLLCLTTLPAVADDTANQYTQQQTATNTETLTKYLLNLGKYLGYNIAEEPTPKDTPPSQTLLNASTTQLMQTYLFSTTLGAIPVNAFSTALSQFLPNQMDNASAINALANNTFNSQNFSSPSSQQGKVSVNPLIDQQTFQQDPVSQSVLNILGTPNSSYCMNYDGTTWTSNCPLLYDDLVAVNVIGALPSTQEFFSYDYNQKFLSQLNSNTLIAPLMYSSQSPAGNSSPGAGAPNAGLTAQNQAQQAANFIRYVSGATTPLKLPKLKDYDTLFGQANPDPSNKTPLIQKNQAQATLSNYFANVRTYAAQNSVGLGNLYYIMSKRLPQNQGGTGTAAASQANSEFNMATWRLFNPADMTTNNQWINQINKASSVTVEKEIATLLAEISYQMYLDRQIQERILLTNSIMLLQNTRATQPSADFSSSEAQ